MELTIHALHIIIIIEVIFLNRINFLYQNLISKHLFKLTSKLLSKDHNA